MSKVEKSVKKSVFCCHTLTIKTTLCDTSFDIGRHWNSSFRKVSTLGVTFRDMADPGNPGKFTFSPMWRKVRFPGIQESPESRKWQKCEKKCENLVHISAQQKKCFFQKAKNNSPNARRNWILATYLPKGIPEELKKIRPHMRLFWGKKHLQFSTAPILRYLSLTAVYRGHPEKGVSIWSKQGQNMQIWVQN